jgi:hypothetical protein
MRIAPHPEEDCGSLPGRILSRLLLPGHISVHKKLANMQVSFNGNKHRTVEK